MLDTNEFKGRFGFGAMRLPMKGGEPDLNRCSASLLFDLRNGKTGRITLDFPEDFGIART